MENEEKSEWHVLSNSRIPHLQNLLSSLQNHLLAEYSLSQKTCGQQEEDSILVKHLRCLFPLATSIFNKINGILEKYPFSLEFLFNILLDSLAGAMLLKIFNSLLLMPASFTRITLVYLLDMLEPLTTLNKYLPSFVQDEEGSHSGK